MTYNDAQGLTAFGYGKLTEASYLLVRIKDAAAARAWCASAPVSTAEYQTPPPDTALQLAFTFSGLRALGVPQFALAGFSAEFNSGMAGEENRSRRLGDVGVNDPANWYWGGSNIVPDMLVMLFAKQNLEKWKLQIQTERWNSIFETMACLSTSNMHDKEPFGFHDGISQPTIDWDRRRIITSDQSKYTNTVALGEFLLGYPNEYGKYTDRPVLDAAADPEKDLPAAEDDPSKKDLGRNGTYFVLRQLDQDVRGFWQFLDRCVNGEAQARNRLGAAMVGRTRDGTSLMAGEPLSGEPLSGEPSSGEPSNEFNYDSDPRGNQCPLGAHVRRANPRNADLFGHPSGRIERLGSNLCIPRATPGDDLIASTRFHRILRRGREYGTPLSPEEALSPAPPDDPPRGLHFGCISANIARQFEFVQSAWLMSTKFNGLMEESDPFLGNRAAANIFSIPRNGKLRRVIGGLPQFVTVRGGAYFFLPGISALRYLSRST